MKTCSQCVLTEAMPHITFDANGVCNFCSQSRKIEVEGEEKLLKLLDSFRSSDKKYDCIVGVSGGRDSTYTLLKMVKDYHMKVLAVNYANPFTDPVALKNIENAAKSLNVDVVQVRLGNLPKKTFKYNFNVWMKDPNPALIPMLCIACKTYYYHIIKIAKKEGIRLIVNGGNPYEDTSFKKELLNVASDEKMETSFIKAITGIIQETLKNPAYYHPVFIPTMIKGYLFADAYCIGSRVVGRGISRFELFKYIEWNEKEIISRIKNELHWESPKNLPSTWRFDCRVGHLKEFLYQKTLGMTERDDLYAKLVRQGLMTREEALERLEKENQIPFEEIEIILKEVGIEDPSFLYDSDFSRK
jgi:hypothetical protein